jgi:hypothetical protein
MAPIPAIFWRLSLPMSTSEFFGFEPSNFYLWRSRKIAALSSAR